MKRSTLQELRAGAHNRGSLTNSNTLKTSWEHLTFWWAPMRRNSPKLQLKLTLLHLNKSDSPDSVFPTGTGLDSPKRNRSSREVISVEAGRLTLERDDTASHHIVVV